MGLPIRGGDIEAAGEARVVGEKGVDLPAGQGIESAHIRAAAGAGHGDDIVSAVAVAIYCSNTDAAGEFRIVGEITQQHCRRAASDVRPPPGPRGDDVALPSPFQVGGHRFLPEAQVIGEEAEQGTAVLAAKTVTFTRRGSRRR